VNLNIDWVIKRVNGKKDWKSTTETKAPIPGSEIIIEGILCVVTGPASTGTQTVWGAKEIVPEDIVDPTLT
jgi:hypothetical protein